MTKIFGPSYQEGGKTQGLYSSTANKLINDLTNIYLKPSLCTEIFFSVQCIMAQSMHADLVFKSNSWPCYQTIKLPAVQIKKFFETDSYESFIHSS